MIPANNARNHLARAAANSPPRAYLITGGAGFIGSNLVDHILRHEPDSKVRVLDCLSYSGTLTSLSEHLGNPRLDFVRGDICDPGTVELAMEGVDVVVNLAAEVSVDRSILDSGSFIRTGVIGVHTLLEAARVRERVRKFVQVSTDEVYGSVEGPGRQEDSPIHPRNPYAAAKLSGEILALSYFETYGLPVVVTRATNTYGCRAHPEKVIPLFITNLIDGKTVPVFGDGRQVRDWLYVEDHCRAILTVIDRGQAGNIYNVGGGQERANIDLTRAILRMMGYHDDRMIRFVKDRPGHDRRYSVDWRKLAALGWRPGYSLEEGLARTVGWYRENEHWWRPLKAASGKLHEDGIWGDRQ
jgi:dTDP-glucose 4,6-dehydratase